MKATLRTIALLAVSSSIAAAATSTIATYYDTSFSTAGGTFLDSSFTAKIGWTDAVSFGNTDNFASISAAGTGWVNVGDITFQTTTAGYAGYFSGVVSYSNAVEGLQGLSIYLWVTDGADQNFVAQLDQVFADDITAPFNSNTYDVQLTTVGDLDIMLGQFEAGTDGFGGGGGNLKLVNAVPEPSVALLGAISAFGILRRRRN